MSSGQKDLPAGQIRALRKFITIMVIVVIVGGALATMKATYLRYNLNPLLTQEARTARDPMQIVRHVTVGGQNLTIPIPYFHSAISPEGSEGDVLLAVSYPEFEPLTKHHRKQVRSFLHVRMLLKSPAQMRNLQDIHDRRKRSVGALDQTDTTNGLPRYVPTDRLKDEIYPVDGDRAAIKGFIECTSSIHLPIVSTRNPQCQYRTERNGIHYKVSFDKDLLGDFRRIQTEVFSIIDSFQHPGPRAESPA
jgi:hypothetical protein